MQTSSPPEKIKVLFLSAWYPVEWDSMFGLFVLKHARAAARKCEVYVLHVAASHDRKLNISQRHEDGLTELIIYYQARQGIAGKLLNLLRWARAYHKGYRMMKKQWGLPMVTHVNILTRTALPALLMKFFHRIPYIITEHWSRYLPRQNYRFSPLHRWLTRYAIKKASDFTTVSEKLGKAMTEKKFSDSYTILPNVVETDLFRISFQEKKAEKPKKTIVHISCFEEKSKNLGGLLKAVKQLSEIRQDFMLRMVGTGEDFDNTVNLASELGLLNTFVVFDGLKEGEELAKVLSAADLSVLTSHYETFGIVVYESLACGVPVLVTDVADFSETIAPEMGMVVPVAAVSDMVGALDRILDNLDTYNPEHLRKFVVEQYSEEAVSNQLLQLYQKALAGEY